MNSFEGSLAWMRANYLQLKRSFSVRKLTWISARRALRLRLYNKWGLSAQILQKVNSMLEITWFTSSPMVLSLSQRPSRQEGRKHQGMSLVREELRYDGEKEQNPRRRDQSTSLSGNTWNTRSPSTSSTLMLGYPNLSSLWSGTQDKQWLDVQGR